MLSAVARASSNGTLRYFAATRQFSHFWANRTFSKPPLPNRIYEDALKQHAMSHQAARAFRHPAAQCGPSSPLWRAG